MNRMAECMPLAALLSQTLAAFTIEFDNEAEHQLPHWTTRHGRTAAARTGTWLTSMVMWSNCMRFVTEEGISVRELETLARTHTNLHGMQRWRYITVSSDTASRDKIIRPTPAGRRAQEIWRPLFGEIEQRWRARFGDEAIGQLRGSLSMLNSRIGLDLPDCLPILIYGLVSRPPDPKLPARPKREEGPLPLSSLLSRVLLAFAIEFERESPLSLAICANVLRVLAETGVRVRDLPMLSGVSKEAIHMAMGILQKASLAVIEPDPASPRVKIARLTPKGQAVKDAAADLIRLIEERWSSRFGAGAIDGLRHVLEGMNGSLFLGLEPYPDGWRASVPKPATLPHFPMVLHRGGYPDGS